MSDRVSLKTPYEFTEVGHNSFEARDPKQPKRLILVTGPRYCDEGDQRWHVSEQFPDGIEEYGTAVYFADAVEYVQTELS